MSRVLTLSIYFPLFWAADVFSSFTAVDCIFQGASDTSRIG